MKSWIGIFIALFIIENTAIAGRIKRHGDEPHECDNGKDGIEIDLHGESDWKCTEQEWYLDNRAYDTDKRCYTEESAYHVCIDKSIDGLYESDIPHSGPHRQVWAQYGEYNYLPPGRYVHNLEHGGVVFMYHPCAPRKMVEKLRQTATTCLYRYIVTAFPKLTEEYPFAVLTYGCIFRMSGVDPVEIKQWIREQFGKSPEPDVFGNGLYNHGLLVPSIDPGSYDYDDDTKPFCPDIPSLGTPNKGREGIAGGNFTESREREAGIKFPEYQIHDNSEKGREEDREITSVQNQDQHHNWIVNDEQNHQAEEPTSPYYDDDSNTKVENFHSNIGNMELDATHAPRWNINAQLDDISGSSSIQRPTHVNVGGGSPEELDESNLDDISVKGHAEISISLESNLDKTTGDQKNDDSLEYTINSNDKQVDESFESKEAAVPNSMSFPTSVKPLVTELVDKGENLKSASSPESSLLLWVFTSSACFVTGLLVGACVMSVRQRRNGDGMKKCRVWSDRDSADSFSIAAVVRKIPNTFTNRKPNDDYHRLEPNDQSSDEDNPI